MIPALVFLAIFAGGLWTALAISDALAVLHGAPTQPDSERDDT